MLELLDECYARYDLPDSQLIQYIKGFFGTPRNFIKYIKARMVEENRDEKSLGELITTTPPYNDSRFALSNFKSPEQQQKWIDFIKSLQETIDNMFDKGIDLATMVGRTDLTDANSILQLRQEIANNGDRLRTNGLNKALDRMIQWKNSKTTGIYTRPSYFLKDIIARVEGDHPTAAAEINKPKLTPIYQDDKVKILPSFLSDSATLYVTFSNGEEIIANSDVDGSALNVLGGLKQTHAHWFEYTPLANLPPGEYILVLKSEQYKSDPLIITVDATHKPVATIAAPARPAETETAAAAPARPAAEAAGAATATSTEAGAARPAVEAGTAAGPAVEAGAAAGPGFFQRLRSRFINHEKLRSKINGRIAVLEDFFKVKPSYIQDQKIVHRLKQQTRTDDINELVRINNELKQLIAKHKLPKS
jgi:hypothetical protein